VAVPVPRGLGQFLSVHVTKCDFRASDRTSALYGRLRSQAVAARPLRPLRPKGGATGTTSAGLGVYLSHWQAEVQVTCQI